MANVEKTLTSVFEAIKDGIYIINQDHILEYMNPVMAERFGEGVGKKCHEVIGKFSDKCPWCRVDDVVSQNQVLRFEYHREDEDRYYEVTEMPLRTSEDTVSKMTILRDVTAYRKQEERLRVTELDYARLFRHVSCGVYVSSKEGKWLDANPCLLDMLGYESKEEFLAVDITRDAYLRPDDRHRFQEMIERHGSVVNYEVEFKRKNGSPISVLLNSNVRYDLEGRVLGYEGIIIDLSETKEMQKKLREANDFFNKLIASSPNAIIAADMRGNIICWNRSAEDLLSYRAEEVLGKMNIVSVYPEGMAYKVMRMLRSPEYGGVGKLRSYPLVAKRRDGQIVESNLSAAIIYDSLGKEAYTVGILVDLRERLAMEQKLRDTQQQLLQSEKLAAMGRLTSQVAHELNNPLYGIMNTLELLKSEIKPESKRRRILEMALSETVRLSELLRKMLTFSKPDQEERQVTDINTLLDEILLLHEKQLREHDIAIRTRFDDGLPQVKASKNQLRQVFLNLVANARDAMPEGGTLSVSTRTSDGRVLVDVTDTGTGIRPEHRDKIFEAFFTTKDSVKGVGLGLSVCYGFIRDHGGDITVESVPGEGATFRVMLPAFLGEQK
jgi:two-component system NtrC family sensor kinase